MPLGGFLGNAATQADESLRAWRELFLAGKTQQEQIRQRDEEISIERDRMAQAQKQHDEDFQNQVKLANVNNFWATFNAGKMSPEAAYQAADALGLQVGDRTIFDPSVAKSMVSGLLYQNPAQASDIIDRALNGSVMPRGLYLQAVGTMLSSQGVTGSERAAQEKEWLKQFDDAQKNAAEGQSTKVDYDHAQVDSLRASTTVSEKQATLLQNQADAVFQDTQFNRDMNPLKLAYQRGLNELQALDIAHNPLEFDARLKQLTAQTEQLIANTTSIEQATDLARRLEDTTVRTAEAALSGQLTENAISRQDLRLKIRTYAWQVMLTENNAKGAQAQVALLEQDLIKAKADNELNGLNQQQKMLEVQASAQNLLAQAVVTNPDIYQATRSKLFELLDIDPEAQPELVAQLDEIASRNSKNQSDLEEAHVAVALSDKRFTEATEQSRIDQEVYRAQQTQAEANWMVHKYYAEGGYADQEQTRAAAAANLQDWATREGLKIDGKNAATAAYNAQTNRMALKNRKSGSGDGDTTTPSVVELGKAITDASGLDANDFIAQINRFNEATKEAGIPLDLTEIGGLSDEEVNQWIGALQGSALGEWETLTGAVASYLNYGYALTGGIVAVPGIPPDSVIMKEALLKTTFVQPAAPVESGGAAESGLPATDEAALAVMEDPTSDSWGASRAVYNSMTDEEKDAAGVTGRPLAFVETIEGKAKEYGDALKFTSQMLTDRGYGDTQNTFETREDLARALRNEMSQQLNPAISQLKELTRTMQASPETTGLNLWWAEDDQNSQSAYQILVGAGFTEDDMRKKGMFSANQSVSPAGALRLLLLQYDRDQRFLNNHTTLSKVGR